MNVVRITLSLTTNPLVFRQPHRGQHRLVWHNLCQLRDGSIHKCADNGADLGWLKSDEDGARESQEIELQADERLERLFQRREFSWRDTRHLPACRWLGP